MNSKHFFFKFVTVLHSIILKLTKCVNYTDNISGYPEGISSRMPTSSCVTCWTTCTGSFSAAATERHALCLHQVASDCQPRREKAACKHFLSSSFQSWLMVMWRKCKHLFRSCSLSPRCVGHCFFHLCQIFVCIVNIHWIWSTKAILLNALWPKFLF